jgi:hypothetical protein
MRGFRVMEVVRTPTLFELVRGRSKLSDLLVEIQTANRGQLL